MRKILVVLTAALMGLTGCAGDMPTVERGQAAAPRRVLIAATASAFKQKVVEGVIARLGIEDYYFKVTGLGNLEREDAASYGAVVLVGSFMAGHLDRRITGWLKDHPADPRTVVFYTRGTDDPMPGGGKPKLDVDAVSAASVESRVNERAGQLVDLILRRF
jgi:hypothetical protein